MQNDAPGLLSPPLLAAQLEGIVRKKHPDLNRALEDLRRDASPKRVRKRYEPAPEHRLKGAEWCIPTRASHREFDTLMRAAIEVAALSEDTWPTDPGNRERTMWRVLAIVHRCLNAAPNEQFGVSRVWDLLQDMYKPGVLRAAAIALKLYECEERRVPGRRPGRKPPDKKKVDEDRRLTEGWNTAHANRKLTLSEYASEIGITKVGLRLAIGRHRKRLAKTQ